MDPAHAPTTPAPSGTELTTPAAAGAIATLVIGERLGDRYVVRAFLGEGGMGQVYRATDEKLGEDVALKIVRGSARVDALREEVRLAQKVTHANVCRTYDLEELAGLQLVKMEFVDGETLATRLARDKRVPVEEAVRIARAIAAGLAAAHGVGIVHRDLKPGNIMLAKQRVVLMDFGIAKQVAAESDSTAGTIGYMAPEQIANTQIDARADLYALGCLLYEMVAGEPVFRAGNRIELAARHVSMPAPELRGVPRWLARAVGDLLAKDPDRRERGLRRLERGRAGTRRIAISALALAAAVAAGGFFVHARRAQPAVCNRYEQRLRGIWDDATKQQVRAAFDATGKPFAAPVFASVSRELDDYSASWVAASVGACEATRGGGDQPEDVLALRQECLDERLEALHANTDMLRTADGGVVEHALAAIAGLPGLARCADVAALRAPSPTPRSALPTVQRDMIALSRARAEVYVGKFGAAIRDATAVAEEMQKLALPAPEAESRWLLGVAQIEAGAPDEALAQLSHAVMLALRAHRDDIAAIAAFSAGQVVTNLGRYDEANVWLAFAEELGAHQTMDRMFEPLRVQAAGTVAAQRGEYALARSLHEHALELARQQVGSDSLDLRQFQYTLAATYAKGEDFTKAVPLYERAVAAVEYIGGRDNPDLGPILSGLAVCYAHLGDLAKARATFDRAIAIREQAFGKDSIALAPTLNNMADMLSVRGDPAGALPVIERAKRMTDQLGRMHPLGHTVTTTYAEILYANHRTAEARAVLDALLSVEQQVHSPILTQTLTSRAALELGEHAWQAAAGFASRAIDSAEAAGGKMSPELWRPLWYLARARAETGDTAAAKPLVERAIAIGEQAHVPASDLAPARELLAKLRP